MRGIAVLGILLIVSSTSFGQKVLGDSERNVYDIAVKDSLLAAVTDNSIELWNALSGKLMNSLPYSASDILTTVVHATGNTVITGTRSGEVRIWNFATADSKVLLPAGSQGAVTSLDFNIEKGLLAAGFHNKKMMVYDVAGSRELFSDGSYSSDVTSVRFTRNNTVVTGSATGRITSYSMDGKSSIVIPDGKWVVSIAPASDSTKLAVADIGGDIRVLTIEKNNVAPRFNMIEKKHTWITSMDYLSSDQTFVYATLSGGVFIEAPRATYKQRAHALVNQVRFIQRTDKFLMLALATRGHGLLLMEAAGMKMAAH